VIAGIGHGHQDVVTLDTTGNVSAGASLEQFQRITPDNVDSFHFHGDPKDYPLSAVILAPHDHKAATILRGRYLDSNNPLRVVVPNEVVSSLVQQLFRMAFVLEIVVAMVGFAALLSMSLAIYLSWNLRHNEISMAKRIGASPHIVVGLAFAEIGLLSVMVVICSSCISSLAMINGEIIIDWLLTF